MLAHGGNQFIDIFKMAVGGSVADIALCSDPAQGKAFYTFIVNQANARFDELLA
ncbi:hypothetical protein D3C73_711460 [compost metagenome]